MRTKDQISFLKILNDNLSQNPLFSNLFDVVGKVIDEQIGEPLAQLNRIRSSSHIKRGDWIKTDDIGTVGKVAHLRRDHDETGPFDWITVQLSSGLTATIKKRALHDRKILVDSARVLGFDYYSDFLSDEDYARIIDYIGMYWSAGSSNSPEFIKFMGFIKNTRLDIQTLWTNDKGDHATSTDPEIRKYDALEPFNGSMLPVWKGGVYYPTSHVEVLYDASVSQNIDLDIIHLFYYLAPIHLVLERISGAIDIEIGYTIRFAGDLTLIDAGFIEIA